MPTIARFYGIIILMHLTRKEHTPPHIHEFDDYFCPIYLRNPRSPIEKSVVHIKKAWKTPAEFWRLFQRRFCSNRMNRNDVRNASYVRTSPLGNAN